MKQLYIKHAILLMRVAGGVWIKEWFTWGDSYKVQILNQEMEAIIVKC